MVTDDGPAGPRRRVVLLGASNLTRGISTVLETARRVWNEPLDVLAALGHGRSYGAASRMLARTMPGIVDCGLWPALAARPAAPTAALISDIGNDLFFGASAEQIAIWVSRCVDRLQEAGARAIMTRLPVCNLDTVQAWQFLALRTVLFPGNRLTLEEIKGRARELDARLLELAARRGVTVVEQRAEWYGMDPIHVRYRAWPRAWSEICGAWTQSRVAPAPSSAARWIYLRTRRSEAFRMFGRALRGAQPCGRLRDGTLVSLY